ncbi:MAG: DUF6325 family protein [Propionibacteriaceae bacterium]
MPELVAPTGPVDIAVIGFPDERPAAAVTAALADAVVAGAVRVLDALIVEKADDGSVTIIDVDDAADALDLLGYPADLPGLLTAEDADEVAADLPDGTSAVIIAWENVWAVRLRSAIDAAGGVVALHERIDPADLTVAVEALVVVE